MADSHDNSRLVFNFPGFESSHPERQLDRLHAHAEKSGNLWGFEVTRSKLASHYGGEDDNNYATLDYSAKGPNWEKSVRLVQFRWEDIILTYEKERYPRLWFVNMPKFLAFFFDGSLFRYFSASARYGFFTIFPLVLMILFAVIGWWATGWFLSYAFEPSIFVTALQAAVTFFVLIIACKWPGDKAYMNLTIADWGFARDMCKRTNPKIEERYQQFADAICDELAASKAKEVIFVGHSFGSVWAVAALAMALKKNPDLLKDREVTFFVLGSSLLKIALVPCAKHFREFAKTIFSKTSLLWHEIQTKIDVIAFYKSDPVKAMGLYSSFEEAPADVVINKLSYSKLMERKRYRKMRKSFYRTHRQYILHLDNRHPADFYLKLFGPFASKELTHNAGLAAKLDENGVLIDN